MKPNHTPRLNVRYWTAITLASVAGTNLGDLYAHESGLGIGKGLALLALLTAVVFVLEGTQDLGAEAYYWLVILLIRTGATNIADYLAYRVRVPEVPLTLSLLALLALFGWGTHPAQRRAGKAKSGLPKTTAVYWLAMLAAGVFGTVVGDIAQRFIGQGMAALALAVMLGITLVASRGRAAESLALYWMTIAIARTAGTAIGDWLAENKLLHLDLPLATALSGLAFAVIVVFWRTRTEAAQSYHASAVSAA